MAFRLSIYSWYEPSRVYEFHHKQTIKKMPGNLILSIVSGEHNNFFVDPLALGYY